MATLLHLALLTGTVLVLAKVMPGVRIKNTGTALVTAAVFSVLSWALGWVLHLVLGAVLFLPAILTLGLAFVLLPFLVNTVILWLTDKVLHAFEIEDLKALLLSSGAITLMNAVFHLILRR